MSDRTKYPKTLYVREEVTTPYHFELRQLIGRENLESAVPDNGSENVVAVYELVSVGSYKKTVTRTATVEKVENR